MPFSAGFWSTSRRPAGNEDLSVLRGTALLTTPAPDPPARGVIEKYRVVKPKSARRSDDSEPTSKQDLVPHTMYRSPPAKSAKRNEDPPTREPIPPGAHDRRRGSKSRRIALAECGRAMECFVLFGALSLDENHQGLW